MHMTSPLHAHAGFPAGANPKMINKRTWIPGQAQNDKNIIKNAPEPSFPGSGALARDSRSFRGSSLRFFAGKDLTRPAAS
jgi:hypothetical protein